MSAPDGIDGISYLPTLLGKPQKAHDHLYWKFKSIEAVRFGPWKAVRLKRGGPIELYDLRTDAGETNDLAKTKPGVLKRARVALSKP